MKLVSRRGSPVFPLPLYLITILDIKTNLATGPIPKFSPTSNPELDSHLDNIRQESFIPFHLPQYYYRLMYRRSRHAHLNDPHTIDVEGKPYELRPKQVQPGPSIKKFTHALSLMKEASEFEVLPELIRGYYQSRRPLRPDILEKVARLANKSGAQNVLMKIAKNAEDIGFKFSRTLAREIMAGLRLQQLRPEMELTLKAFGNAKKLLNIVGRRELCVEKEKRLSEDPVVVGTVLSIAADTYLRFGNEENHRESTKNMALKLKACWEDVEWNVELHEANAEDRMIGKQQVMRDYYMVKNMIRQYTPVLEGMLQAKSVLASSELSPWLEEESERLAALIAGWGEFIERNTPILFPPRKDAGETFE